MQVTSLSYDAASGNIAIGRVDGLVELWQTARVDGSVNLGQTAPHEAPAPREVKTVRRPAPQAAHRAVPQAAPQAAPEISPPFSFQFSPQAAPQSAPQALPLPAHVCVRERLAAAQTQVKDTEASLVQAENGLRQQMSREQELKQSIADLEAKCAYISDLVMNAKSI